MIDSMREATEQYRRPGVGWGLQEQQEQHNKEEKKTHHR